MASKVVQTESIQAQLFLYFYFFFMFYVLYTCDGGMVQNERAPLLLFFFVVVVVVVVVHSLVLSAGVCSAVCCKSKGDLRWV